MGINATILVLDALPLELATSLRPAANTPKAELTKRPGVSKIRQGLHTETILFQTMLNLYL